ncbi:hypothetical protein QN277_007838 [Acacia crassicarpa]|uniref:Apyrase n=1 Tax=Acacia crassicarpa TaxID=499986 RepID=A0AAE1MDG8_9FABA|nr:hypothetical protein QN277_007838 [Acacia crassicarpa]
MVGGSNSSSSNSTYAAILDSGSTGTRIHVFRFNQSLQLIHIDDDFEYYYKVTPGLSSYTDSPEEVVESVMTLLVRAESVVLEEYQAVTPLRLGVAPSPSSLSSHLSLLSLFLY